MKEDKKDNEFVDFGCIDENPEKFLNLLKERGKENLPFDCKFLYRIPFDIKLISNEYSRDYIKIDAGTLLCVKSFQGEITKNNLLNFNFCRFHTEVDYMNDNNLKISSLKSKDDLVSGLCWWKYKKFKFKIIKVEDNLD